MAARSVLEYQATDPATGDASGSASVYVFEMDGTTPLGQVMYSSLTGSATLTNPLTADTTGLVRAYVTTRQRCLVRVGSGTFYTAEFRPDPADMALVSGQTLTSPTLTGATVGLADGTAAAPSLSFTSDPNTGLYSAGADTLGVTTGGSLVGSFQSTGLRVPDAATAANPALSFITDTDTGLFSVSANVLGVSVGGSKVGEFHANGVRGAAGVVATPSLSFTNDTDTGFYSSGANEISAAAGGAQVATLQANGLRVPDASTASLPALSFITDTDTGIYNAGANQLGVATGGANRGTWSSAGLTMGTNLPVIPGAVSGTPAANALYQEGVVKGWCRFNNSGTVSSGFNVSGVTHNGNGDYTVTWLRAFTSEAALCAVVTVHQDAVLVGVVTDSTSTAGATRMLFRDLSGTATNLTGTACIVVMGTE